MRSVFALVFVILCVAALPCRAEEDLDKTLRKLEGEIEKVRGLKYKKPVQAKIIPRPESKPNSIQGYYSTKEKTLYLYDDIGGNYRRGVLIHEMVHALQDQHFGLDKLHEDDYGSDAGLAKAALIEGDATLTMIEMLKKDQPRVAAMLETSLVKSKNLRNAFLYAQGARYVQALKKKGGWKRVDSAYRFGGPSSTASVLHPDERISTIDLGPGKTRGELGLIDYLRENLPTERAHEVAHGWRGDRYVKTKAGFLWSIVFDTEEQAERAKKALADSRKGESKETWTGRVANKLHLVVADSTEGVSAARERLIGPTRLIIRDNRHKRNITFGAFLDQLMEADIICIGESHNSDLHHQLQHRIIKAVYSQDERLAVGMEMFQRPYQKFLDEYVARKLSEKDMLAKTEYAKRWGYHWSMYRPIVDFCWRNEVPLIALNAPRELTSQISKLGVEKVSAKEKKELGDIDYHVKKHRDYWYERLAKMHGQKDVPEDRKERSYQVMTTWDGFMADSAARFKKERDIRRLVLLAGSGHISRGFGIPDRTVKRVGGRAVTIEVVVGKPDKKKEEPTTDFRIHILADD